MTSTTQSWTDEIPEDQWQIYQGVLDELTSRAIPFALGGAFGVAAYTGRWRNTKDLDIYITPDRREEVIQVLTSHGLQDYYEVLPYVREWIYRSHKGDIIVDVIWAMANQCANVDEYWLSRGAQVTVKGEVYRSLPPEELIWAKIFVMNKERTDWPDIFNIFAAVGSQIDWSHLLDRIDQELPLLRAVVSVFGWLDPGTARQFPAWLWARLGLPAPEGDPSREQVKFRADLLDTRPWFLPVLHDV
jgi:hypothetical protein